MKKLLLLLVLLVAVPLPVYGAGPGAGDTNVYRLYNPRTGDHFYTTNDAERISQSCPKPHADYAKAPGVMPGVIFKAYASASPSQTPVYRLFNPHTVSYLYTPV